VDTSESPDDPCQGGCIASPRLSDKEQQVRQRQLSIFDIAGLASPLYHGDVDGVPELSVSFIHACGYQSFSPETPNDVLLCYRDIQQLHKKVRQGWYNPRTHLSGPSIERILERGIPVFPKLESLTAAVRVTFYDKLQELLAICLLPLMPFDALRVEFNFEGLYVLGLGTNRYADCASALMEILPRLLPPSISEVQVKISAIRSKSKNGYDLFWRIWSSPFRVSAPPSQSSHQSGRGIRTYWSSAVVLNFISDFLPNRRCSTTLGPAPTCSCAALPRQSMLMLSP
jgi:hypothetical protein